MKKWTILGTVFLALLISVGCSPAVTSASSGLFPDVPSDSSHADAVTVLARARIIAGFDNGTFGPVTLVTRQQFAKMIVLALRIPASEADICPFADVARSPVGNLYPDHYIAACAKKRITEGTSPGKFSPTQVITRAQVITMVIRGVDNMRPGVLRTPPKGYVSTWGDFDHTHGPAAAIAEYNGLLANLPISSESPWGGMPRAEVAQLLANLVVHNVKDFGALGAGADDDTAAIQAAIDRAASMGGGIVYFPAGDYRLTGSLHVSSSHTVLLGEGAGSAITAISSPQPEMIKIEGTSSIDDIEMRELSLVGNYSNSNQVGIAISGLRSASFENLSITDLGFCGIFAFRASDVIVNSCTVTHCADFGIQFKEGSRDVTVSNCRLDKFQSRQYPGHAIYFESVVNAVAFGNYITNLPSGYGGEISGIKYSGASGHCYGNVIEDVFGGISIPGGHDVLIEGNTIRRTIERGIYILAGANNITIKNNTLEDAGRGIQFGAFETWPTNVHLVGNTVKGGWFPVDLYGGPASMIVEMADNSWQ